MGIRKVMIVRHAEKPPKHGAGPQGIGLSGVPNADDLIPRGWQRAGALVTIFAPCDGSAPRAPIERPSAIFAAGTSADSPSLRPQSTIKPVALACSPKLAVRAPFAPGDEANAAEAIRDSGSEVCLVCWEHKHIEDLVREITQGAVQSPHWDGTRFDMIFVLTLEAAGWRLQEVPQMLLSGDMTDTVSTKDPAVEADVGEDERALAGGPG